MRLNNFKWDAEGLEGMKFTADFLNTTYDCCKGNCEKCLLYADTTKSNIPVCLIITAARDRVIKVIEEHLKK